MSEDLDVKLQIMAYSLALTLACHEKKLSSDQTVCFATMFPIYHHAKDYTTNSLKLPPQFLNAVVRYRQYIDEYFLDPNFVLDYVNQFVKECQNEVGKGVYKYKQKRRFSLFQLGN